MTLRLIALFMITALAGAAFAASVSRPLLISDRAAPSGIA